MAYVNYSFHPDKKAALFIDHEKNGRSCHSGTASEGFVLHAAFVSPDL